jgi:transcriptional regulator with XRE-family HTH domain
MSSVTGLARQAVWWNDSAMSKLAHKIATFRIEKRMSQAELGAILGVTRSSVQQWEADKTVPQLHHLMKMADFFRVSLAVLMGSETSDQSIDAELRFLPKDVADALKASFLSTIAAVKKSKP